MIRSLSSVRVFTFTRHNMDNNNLSLADQPIAEGINLRHYWHVTLERRWLVITVFLSILILSLVYLFRAPKIYEAVAVLQIDRESENVLNIKDVFSMDGREQDYLQTQYKNLQSRTLIETMITNLGLSKDAAFAQTKDIYKAVASDISISPVRLSRLVNVKVENKDPVQAARIANALAETFVKRNLDIKLGKSTEATDWLKKQADELEKEVNAAERALQDYKEKSGLVSLDESVNIASQALRQAQTELDRADSDASTATKLASEVKRLVESGTKIDSIMEVSSDVLIKQMKQNLAEKEAKLANLLTRYKAKHPDVIQAQKDVDSYSASLQTEAQKIFDAIQNQAVLAVSKAETALQRRVAQEKIQVTLGTKRIEYEQLSRKAQQSKLLYNNVLARMKETEVAGKIKTNNMSVIDPAVVPQAPIKPKTIVILALVVFGGFTFSLGLAFFVNYLDDSIKGQDDVETYLGLPFLGYVPHIETNSIIERDLQAHLHPTSSSAEAFRTVRAAVSLANLPEKLRTIVLTSTVPSEGKSLVASNLAIVTAQSGLKTLLVEADLRRPTVHKTFQLHSPLGIASYLQGKITRIDEIIHKTEVPNLDVICCGAIPSNPSELIGSARMQEFLVEARKQYDRLVLDCPPISAVSDPLVTSAMADGLIFVSEFNKIRREHARKTVMRVQNAGIHILGAVINNIDFEGKDSYYYSHYYYQNGYYSSHYKPEKNQLEEQQNVETVKKS